MTNPAFQIDDSNMPVVLGSALRVPSYAYGNWGIPPGSYREASDNQYSIEWEGGSKNQMDVVIEAIKATGLGNFSQTLRDSNNNAIAHLIGKAPEKVNYLEPGAGVSTVHLYKKLSDDGVDLDQIFATLIEPSPHRMEAAVADLEKMGLKNGKNFVYHTNGATDNHVLSFVNPGTQDIIGTVAQIHHHAYLDSPMYALICALKENGYLVSSDWHNSMWEHPNRVYEYLKNEFHWDTKEKDLAAFEKAFPNATRPAPDVPVRDEAANDMIRKFWGNTGYAKVRQEAIDQGRFAPSDDILMLEGHRPVEQYIKTASEYGAFHNTQGTRDLISDDVIKTNPLPLVNGSSILNTLVLQKSKRLLVL